MIVCFLFRLNLFCCLLVGYKHCFWSHFQCGVILTCRHENGMVKFWDVTTGAMRLIYELKTANLFVGQESESELLEDFSNFKWPPYYQASSYDPFEDDPRLSIKFIEFCPLSRTLCVGGNGGQVITFSLNPVPSETLIEVSSNNHRVKLNFIPT